ncbi:hypothetical protein ACFV9C_42165 [Kribbella sp. NPDC059898]|uniref:hypothetical protein n=1 Tax=Kribbella sp. NPDC059898 TaxID=3346995 RepID=UPI00365B202C
MPITSADKIAYTFYATAAVAALTGQVWAGVEHISWPDAFPIAAKIALVTPAVAVLELGGVATAGLADVRRRLGETAYVYRTLSILSALAAVVVNLAGHWNSQRFIGFCFAGLSAFAYILWLAHSSARRRDALRRRRMLSQTAPVYGLIRWLQHPLVTWRARSLALEHGLGLYESIRAAEAQIEAEQRDTAIKEHISDLIEAEQGEKYGPRGARIATATYDMQILTDMLKDRLDYEGTVDRLSEVLRPGGHRPELPPAPTAGAEATSAMDPDTDPPEGGPRGDGPEATSDHAESEVVDPAVAGDVDSTKDHAAAPVGANASAGMSQAAEGSEASPAEPAQTDGDADAMASQEAEPGEELPAPWTLEKVFELLDSWAAEGKTVNSRLLQEHPELRMKERTARRRIQEWKKDRGANRRRNLQAVN